MPKKQTDGRYRAEIVVGHKPNGDPIVKYASGRTKPALEAAKKEIKQRYIGGVYAVQRDMTFRQYAPHWLKTYKRPGLRDSSYRDLESVVNFHLIPAFGDRQLRAITQMDLQALLNAMGEEAYSSSMIDKVHKTICQMFRRAASPALRLVDINPAVELTKPKGTRKKRRALTDVEDAAVNVVMTEHKDRLLLMLLYYLGVRRGEALGLQWGDVDFKQHTVHIQRDIDFKALEDEDDDEDGAPVGDLKTAAANRFIPIPDALHAVLLARRGIGSYIIQGKQSGDALCEASYRRAWRRLMDAVYDAALKAARELDPERQEPPIELAKDKEGKPLRRSMLTAHYFRHNYCSRLHAAGVDVLTAKTWLGHAKIDTVLNIYTELSAKTEAGDVSKVNAAFGAGK